jgi:predicted ATPase
MNTTEHDIDDDDRRILGEILQAYESGASLPEVARFRVQHAGDRPRIDALLQRGLVEENLRRYYLTLAGLRACDSATARAAYGRCETLLSELQNAYLDQPGKVWDALEFGDRTQRSKEEVSRLITLMRGMPGLVGPPDGKTGFTAEFRIDEPILEATLPPWPEEAAANAADEEFAGEPQIERLEISGYRPFSGFAADLAPLTVIIGANASGKSSLFDALRLVAFAAENPLPPEIDPRNASVTALFHAGGPERIDLALTASLGLPQSVRYEVSIHGPVGAVRVARERLTTVPSQDDRKAPFVLLDFSGGKGTVRDPRERALNLTTWATAPNELALRQASQPLRKTLHRFQRFLASWRFYSGFDVSPQAAVRRSAHIEENPVLAEDGSNLSAVLSSLILEHREAWEELETHLRSVIPTFLSLGVKPQGARGMAIGTFRERGVKDTLTLGDLSDGTLRLLCWLALAVSPNAPPLMCLDEPEIGLHPRVLPTLAGAFKMATARSQVLIATHSPHLLAQFALDDIAVMRKEDGHAVFVRPSTSDMLRTEVAEIGGDAIARLFLSEELEGLP